MLKQHYTSYHLRRIPVVGGGSQMHARRMASHLQKLQSDFGKPTPPGRPGTGGGGWVYVVEPETRRGSFGRYVRSAAPEKWYIAGAICGVCLYSASTLAIPAGFGTLIDHATKGALPIGTSYQLIGWVAGVCVANFVRLYCIGSGGERMIARMRSKLFKAIMKQPTQFFDSPDNRTGALVQRLSLDCNVMGSSLTEAVAQGTKNTLQCLGSIGVMLYYSPTLTGVIVGLLPPSVLFAAYYGRYVRRLQASMQDAMAEKGIVAEERLGNIRVVRAFGREKEEMQWYNKKVDKVLGLSLRMQRYNAAYVACLHGIGYFTLYMMLWGGSMLVAAESLSAGHLFSFMLYTVYCGIGMTGLTNLFTDINKGYGASLRVYDIIDKAERLELAEQDARLLKPLEAINFDITFNAVDFAYPTRPEAAIFRQLNAQVPSGLCTCIVGSSGSGKSTMGHLLAKLYAPDAGSITIGGYDVADLDPRWLRSRIGIVNQEPVLFGGSIAQNIAYGIAEREWDEPIDEWTLSAVSDAAKQANAHDFITALPEGYDTYVGEGGKSLSGGQKQRIAIARALLRNPSLLILDESTSALDAESEIIVAAAIEKLIDEARANRRRTVLMFAHKLSMIRKADKIIVLHDGAVADEGDYEHVSRNPLFRQLVGLDSIPRGSRGLISQRDAAAAAAAAETRPSRAEDVDEKAKAQKSEEKVEA